MLRNVDAPAWLRGKSLLIFDFDGTVADTSPLHAAAFVDVLGPLGVSVHYDLIAGMKTSDAILTCARTAGVELHPNQLSELVVAKQRLVRQLIERDLRPLPGVDAFLRWARPKYRLSMATSGSRGTVELALMKLGYDQWFDPLVCAEDVQWAKPHPDLFLRVLELTGYKPQDALVFEDSDMGITAALAANIQFILVDNFFWASHRI